MAIRSSVFPSFHPSVLPYVRPSVRPSIRPSVRSSFRPSVCPSVLPSFRWSVHPSVRASVRPSIRPSVRPPVLQALCSFSVRFPWHFVTNLRLHSLCSFCLRFLRSFAHKSEVVYKAEVMNPYIHFQHGFRGISYTNLWLQTLCSCFIRLCVFHIQL